VKGLYQEQMDALQAQRTALKIGVNIRAGNAVFGGLKVGYEVAHDYIACAEEIETTRKRDNQTVIW